MYHFPEEIRKAYESQPIALVYDMLVDGKALPILVSDGFCELVGMNRENTMEWFKKGQFERIHPDDVGLVNHVSEIFANKESGYDIIFRTRHSDGYHVIHAVGKWQTMPDGTELALLTYADITENAEAVASTTEKYQLFKEDHFYTDSLTGLPNLNYLNKFADERLHAIRTEGNTPIIIYIDVIAMQYYNNQYGYQKGNDLLCLIRDLLNDKFPTALVCRGADDHFIVIDRYENNTVTEDILSSIGDMIRAKAYGRTSGIRCGVCIVEPDMNAAEAEDHAKSAIKWLGTDLSRTCHFYTHITQDILWNQRDIINHVDQALSEEWIKVYYQGIVNTKTGKGASLEALARWNDPKRGLLSPGEFIPVLEKHHLMYRLDLYMAEQVCKEMIVRKERGLPNIPVSVNFSAQDFEYHDIATSLTEIYCKYNPDDTESKKLIIEITEQDMATAKESFKSQLQNLSANGFKIWLDDFGSGYSSLNMFSHMDVDLIKFDMEFMHQIDDARGANKSILKAMTTIANEMGIHTLAEGIENENQWLFLQNIGCEFSQGYFFHRPELLEAILYRLDCGQKILPCEVSGK